MALNSLGSEMKQPVTAPVSLPRISLPEVDDQTLAKEVAEAAARVAERRIIRAGVDAWESVAKAESFGAWKTIGAALAVGKAHALKASGAKQAWGSGYSRAFNDWVRRHGFERMRKSVHSVAVELHENISAIEVWRSTLSEKDQRRLVHPLSNVRRWRAARTPKPEADALAKAETAWRNFTRCMSALSPEQAAPLWQAVQAATVNVCFQR